MPSSNSRLKAAALTGYVFTGKTEITFDGTNTMDVVTRDPANAGTVITYNNMALPSNGVIYVEKIRRLHPRRAARTRTTPTATAARS